MFRDPPAKGSLASPIVPPVQRRTVTEEVLDRLRDLLLRGVLKPGSRVDQAELAASFGISTVPVREALLRLESAGLVQLIPHRGVFVSEVSVEELLDIYTTRELLEEQAARLAVPNLTPEDVAALEGIAADMQAAATKGQLDELLTRNRDLHFTIYRATKRRHLLQLIEYLWDLSTRYAHLQLHTVPDRATEALYEVRSMVAACKRRDADALALMVRYKVHQTTTGLLTHMSLPETSALPGASARGPSMRRGGASKDTEREVTARKDTAGGRAPRNAAPRKDRAERKAAGKNSSAKAASKGSGTRRTPAQKAPPSQAAGKTASKPAAKTKSTARSKPAR